MEPTVSSCDDFIAIGGPCEWLGFASIVFVDEAVDGSLQINDGMEDAVFEPSPCQLGEEALYSVQPGT